MLNPILKSVVDLADVGPPHPGEVLREEFLPHYRVSAAELARRMGVTLPSLEGVLAERAPVTQMLAEQLGQTIGHGARYWMGLQLQYDLWHGSLASSQQTH